MKCCFLLKSILLIVMFFCSCSIYSFPSIIGRKMTRQETVLALLRKINEKKKLEFVIPRACLYYELTTAVVSHFPEIEKEDSIFTKIEKPTSCYKWHSTALHKAVEVSSKKGIRAILSLRPALIGEEDSHGQTPVELAVSVGNNFQALKALLDVAYMNADKKEKATKERTADRETVCNLF